MWVPKLFHGEHCFENYRTGRKTLQCYNIARNMSWHFDGIQAHISKKLQRNIQYLRCLAHRRNIINLFCRDLQECWKYQFAELFSLAKTNRQGLPLVYRNSLLQKLLQQHWPKVSKYLARWKSSRTDWGQLWEIIELTISCSWCQKKTYWKKLTSPYL